MCRLIETIRIQDGKACHLSFHSERLNNSRKELFGITRAIDLQEVVAVPGNFQLGTVKCRIVYDREIISIGFSAYSPKVINNFKLIYNHEIEYPYKFEDRSLLNHLLSDSLADEIIIVKNGIITDTSYSNLAFRKGSEWFTPSKPLLKGTMRQYLLETGRLRQAVIKPKGLPGFTEFRLINSMLPLESSPSYPVHRILS